MNWQPIEVIDIKTGDLITIKDTRFNPELHKLPKLEDAKLEDKPKKTKKVKSDK